MGRREASTQRRRSILDAALRCFGSAGYDATTMAHIRREAGASTGSIYHHFKSKEMLAAQLYLEGVGATQAHGLQVLRAERDTEAGIRGLVGAYLDWVQTNRDLATFLLTMRHADFMQGAEQALGELNSSAALEARGWFQARIESGELPDLTEEVYSALLYGGVSAYARRWVAGKSRTDIATARKQLAQAAWAALTSLR